MALIFPHSDEGDGAERDKLAALNRAEVSKIPAAPLRPNHTSGSFESNEHLPTRHKVTVDSDQAKTINRTRMISVTSKTVDGVSPGNRKR
ncbi:hypothetical protein RB195_016988 [Necator americanus]|uniref:Uncharacterized protein n=1 Tax=Necator americanus TaxID=51031 RepID=A0ABR1C336_NECAM